MKKIFSCLLFVVFLMPVAALCEEVVEVVAEVVASEIPTEPFTWQHLGTIAGAAMATMLIVQLLKLPLDRVWKIPTRIIVFLIAAVVMLAATYFTVGLTWSSAALTVLNAVIAALTAMGGYELTFRKLEERKLEEMRK